MTGRPLIPLTIGFTLGILSALSVRFLLLALLGTATAVALSPRSSRGQITFLLAFMLLGYIRYTSLSLPEANDVSHLLSPSLQVTGVVDSEVRVTATSQHPEMQTAKFVLKAVQAQSGGSLLPVSGLISVRLLLHSSLQNTDVSQKRSPELPTYGDRLWISGELARPDGARNPGGFDNRRFLAEQGILSQMLIKRPEQWHILGQERSVNLSLLPLAYAVKHRVLEQAGGRLSPLNRSVLNGILVGERGELPGDLNDDFARTGTAHILATAGLHIGLFVVLALGLLRRLRFPLRPAQALTLFLLALYALMAGGRPAVVRAVTIAMVYLAGALLEREPDLPSAIALAALIQLLYNPRSLFDAGFQMSFATVITIALLLPFAATFLHDLNSHRRKGNVAIRVGYGILEFLCACFFLTLTAQIGASPLVAYYFNDISLIAPIANILVVPAITLVLGLGFTATALGTLAPILALPLYCLLDLLLTYILYIVQACARLPLASLSLQPPSFAFLIGYYAIIWGLAWRWQLHATQQTDQEGIMQSNTQRTNES